MMQDQDAAIQEWRDRTDEMGLEVNESVNVGTRRNGHGQMESKSPVYLDARKRKVAQMRVEGFTNKEIARAVGVDLSTVERDVTAIRRKYGQLTKTDWRKVLEAELIRLDSDEQNLRNMLNFEVDVDRALRIYDRILKTGDARRRVLAIEDAAKLARGVPTEQEIKVTLEFDGSGKVIDIEPDDVEEAEFEELDMSSEVEIDFDT